MSGSTIGGVVGAAVGFWIGGPQGAQWGWMIGSAVGGYIDPTQIQGPRLQDARTQTSRDGVAIPFGWGTFPLAGNIIWQQPNVTEHKNTETQGKGGPEVTTFTYTRSYAIGLCEGPIAGILQIKRNGKLVYDARDDATLEAEYQESLGPLSSIDDWRARISLQRAMNSRFISKCEIYLGDETQTPDPTIESYEGVGNVPAYRGLAYIVVTDDDVTDLQGAIAQYEFVVAACGDVTAVDTGNTWLGTHVSGFLKDSPDGWDWSAAATTINLEGGGEFTPAGSGHLHAYLGEVLGVSSSNGVFGGDLRAFRDTSGVWHALAGWPGTGTGSHQIVRTPTHWMVARHISGGIAISSDPLTEAFTDTGYTANSICLIGANVLSALAIGSTGDDIGFRVLSNSGASVSTPDTLFTGYNARNPILASSGSSLTGMAVEEHYGSGSVDRRVHIHSSGDNGETWEEHTSPFPDFPVPSSWPALQIQYSPLLGYWVVTAKNRIAVGASLGSLSLLPDATSGDITGMDEDGQKFVICCDDGSIYSWTAADGLQERSTGTTQTFMDVVAFGIPDDAVPIPDSPGNYVGPDGQIYFSSSYSTLTPCGTTTLAEIVGNLCEREGLTADEYDVSELTDVVPGFRVANEGDAASAIAALQPSFFFDTAEFDGKIRFKKRGGTSVFAINGDDLVERDGDAFERERVQEAELLRRVTVGYIDPMAAYGPTTQKWERRVGTVQAKGEASMELPLTLSANSAATIAKKRGLVAWGEPEKQKFSLPYRLAALTPTDVGTYTDADGEIHALRLMQAEDDSGIRYIESSTNSAEAYNAVATGVSPKAPALSGITVAGPTFAVYMNLPSLRTQDNVPGVTIAACGLIAGWPGAAILLSVDGGISYQQLTTFTQPSSMGRLTANCTASSEPISVRMASGSLSSITEDQIASRLNAFAITTSDVSELGQFQTSTAGSSDTYDLTNNVRGLLGTTAASHYSSAPFVMVSTAQFVPLDIGLAGRTLYFKAVTSGTSADSAEAVPFVFTPMFSSVTVEAYTDDNGFTYTDDADNTYYYEASA